MKIKEAKDNMTISSLIGSAKRDYAVSPKRENSLILEGQSRSLQLKQLKEQPKMKQLVKELPKPTIEPVTLEQLTNNELVAYHCQSSGNTNNYAVLAKMDGCKWGFVNLGSSNNQPVYQASTRQDCIKLASTSRTLYMFDNITELIRCIYAKVF